VTIGSQEKLQVMPVEEKVKIFSSFFDLSKQNGFCIPKSKEVQEAILPIAVFNQKSPHK
jgi:hypothetical protein